MSVASKVGQVIFFRKSLAFTCQRLCATKATSIKSMMVNRVLRQT